MKIDRFGIPHVSGLTPTGPFVLSRNLPHLIHMMDLIPELERINKNKKIWYLRPDNLATVDVLRADYDRKLAYIIGKGPTLNFLTKDDFPDEDAVVICCNNSTKKILTLGLKQKLFLVQCDPDAGHIDIPEDMPVIVTLNCLCKYSEHPTTYYGSAREFNTYSVNPVGNLAIAFAKLLGCDRLNLVAFDGAFGGSCEYGDAIGYKSSEHSREPDPKRFQRHRQRLITNVGNTPCVILIKTGTSSPSDGIPLPSPHNQKQPSVPASSQSLTENKDTLDSPLETEQPQHETQRSRSKTEQSNKCPGNDNENIH